MEFTFESENNVVRDEQVKSLLKSLNESTQDDEQKDLISELFLMYEGSDRIKRIDARNAIIELFSIYNTKKILKKYMLTLLCKLSINDIVMEAVNDLKFVINHNKICNMKKFTQLQHFLYVIQNVQKNNDFVMNQVLPLYHLIFEGFVLQTRLNFQNISSYEELMLLMNSIFKQILSGFVKSESFKLNVTKDYSLNFLKLSYEILKYEGVGYDIKTKSGLILAHSLMLLPQDELIFFDHKSCPVLELIENSNKPTWFILNSCSFDNILANDSVKVVIYSAIFNVVPTDKFLEIKINNKDLVVILYEELINCAKRTTSNPPQIVEVSRILSMIGKHLKSLSVENVKDLFIHGLQFVWSHIDHFVDTVRNYTKIICTDIVSLAAYHSKKGSNECFNILMDNISSTTKTNTIWFVTIEQLASFYGCIFLLKTFPNIQYTLINLLSEITIRDLVCKTYTALMELHFQETNRDEWCEMWVNPITNLLKDETDYNLHYQYILTQSFKVYPSVIRKIFPNHTCRNSQESGVLLKLLKLARSTGIIVPQENEGNYWRGLIDKTQLDLFKIHQEDEIRISVLAVIVDSQKSTELFLDWEFNYLLSYLKYNITSQVPNIRKQMITYYKSALARYDSSYSVILRNLKKTTSENEKYKSMAEYYRRFIKDFAKLLIGNLARDANFPRRSASLELLLIVQPSLKDDWNGCWSKDDVLNCLNILYDSYESNKKMAVRVLQKLPPSLIGFEDNQFTKKYVQNCISLAQDIKPSKTLSAAYIFQICSMSPHFERVIKDYLQDVNECDLCDSNYLTLTVLTEILGRQSDNIIDVGNLKTSQYGIILSIRHLLENRHISKHNNEYSKLFKKLVDICLKIKTYIMPVVCNPSPEGYLPENTDTILETDESAVAQMVLVYAWRTIKEMTLLLAEIVKQTIKLEESIIMLTETVLITIGEFFIEIFIESKHRGVFEQAYVGFSTISQSFWISRNQEIFNLPKSWLKEVLNLCIGIKHSDKLCATRRSAGLPFLILSILTTDPSHDKACFHNAMKILMNCCEDTTTENEEYRMHCLNILRALFRHSKLGELVSTYIGKAVIASITGFKSPAWGIRNSATLLYSALMTRMFGVQRTQDSEDLSMKNRLTVRVFFMRYPELFQFLLDTLGDECRKTDSLILHPVLMILARLYPSHIEEYNTQMDQYLPFVTICLANPVYRTRELAARASIPLISNVASCFEKCFENIHNQIGENDCHGHLLQVWHLIKANNLPPDLPLTDYLNKSFIILEKVGINFSHLTLTLYIEVITNLLIRYKNYNDAAIFEKLPSLITNKSISFSNAFTVKRRLAQALMRLLIFLLLKKVNITHSSYAVIILNIISYLYGKDEEMKRYCLYFLIYANMSYYKHIIKHPLFDTEELIIPEDISQIIDTLDKECLGNLLFGIHPYLQGYFSRELKCSLQQDHNTTVLTFLLLNFYPCIIKNLYDIDECLRFFIDFCNTDNEELQSAVIGCITTLLANASCDSLKSLSYGRLVELLMESASPAAADYRRLSVCEFLTTMNSLFIYEEDPVLKGKDIVNVLHICMVLLEDDDSDVRNSLSSLFLKTKIRKKYPILFNIQPSIPEKVKEDILELSTKVLSKSSAINFLFSWSCRHFPDYSNDVSEIFERGELNLFAENILTINISSMHLNNLLWTKESDFDRKNHTKKVTCVLLDSITRHSSPMMKDNSKQVVIDCLNLILTFIESYVNGDFHLEFKNYYTTTIVDYLRKNVKNTIEISSIKKLFDKVFAIVLVDRS